MMQRRGGINANKIQKRMESVFYCCVEIPSCYCQQFAVSDGSPAYTLSSAVNLQDGDRGILLNLLQQRNQVHANKYKMMLSLNKQWYQSIENITELDLSKRLWNPLLDSNSNKLALRITGYVHLKKLCLDSNYITDDVASTLVQPIANMRLRQLQELSMQDNKMTWKALQHLEGAWKGCTSLQKLNLAGNQITGAGLVYLTCLSNLTDLNLKSNAIESGGDALQHLTSLSVLVLAGNKLGNSGSTNLAQGLRHCIALEKLDLQSNLIDNEGLKILRREITQLSRLKAVVLDNNPFDANHLSKLIHRLRILTHVSFLSLKNNKLHRAEGKTHIFTELVNCEFLEQLYLEHNFLNDTDMTILSQCLSQLQNLSTLSLAGNQMTREGARGLLQSVSQMSSLKSLDLKKNDLQPGTGRKFELLILLEKCTNLTELTLNETQILTATSNLSELNANPHLTTLGLQRLLNADISDQDVQWMETWLSSFPCLHTLDLSQNPVGCKLHKLLESVFFSRTLKKLDLTGIKMTDYDFYSMSSNMTDPGFRLETLILNDTGIFTKALTRDKLRTITKQIYGPFYFRNVTEDKYQDKILEMMNSAWKALKELHLKQNSIDEQVGWIFDIILGCPDLTDVNLEENEIRDAGAAQIAERIPKAMNLSMLNLRKNRLSETGVEEILEAKQKRFNLKHVDLRDNIIDLDLSKRLWNPLLDCETNGLALKITRFVDLKRLCLDSNDITDKVAATLVQGIANMHQLESLSMQYNQMTQVAMQHLEDAWQGKSSLRKLNLKGNQITGAGLAYLTCLSNLTDLNVDCNQIEWGGDAFQHLTSLRFLYLAENKFSGFSCFSLAQGLRRCTCLQKLDLRSNEVEDEGLKYLDNILPQLPQLQVLDLTHNKLDTRNLQQFCEKSTNLAVLRVSQNNFTDEEQIQKLLSVLLECKLLVQLALIRNELTDSDILPLRQNLTKLANLQELFLGFNQIEQEGANDLLAKAEKLKKLKLLNLAQNNIGFGVNLNFRRSLAKCYSLHTLSLNRTNILDEKCQNLLETLKDNSSLTVLSLQSLMSPEISEQVVKKIGSGLKRLKALKVLYLSQNPIGSKLYRIFDSDNGYRELKKLDLQGIQMSNYDFYKMSFLMVNKTDSIETLNLNNTTIFTTPMTDEDLEEIARQLTLDERESYRKNILSMMQRAWRNLKELHLKQNSISNQVGWIFDITHGCQFLQKINLCDNEITDTDAKQISERIPKQYALSLLNLSKNKLSYIGVKLLLEAKKKSDTLKALDLRNNLSGSDSTF